MSISFRKLMHFCLFETREFFLTRLDLLAQLVCFRPEKLGNIRGALLAIRFVFAQIPLCNIVGYRLCGFRRIRAKRPP
jgi:hypothetical protein